MSFSPRLSRLKKKDFIQKNFKSINQIHTDALKRQCSIEHCPLLLPFPFALLPMLLLLSLSLPFSLLFSFLIPIPVTLTSPKAQRQTYSTIYRYLPPHFSLPLTKVPTPFHFSTDSVIPTLI